MAKFRTLNRAVSLDLDNKYGLGIMSIYREAVANNDLFKEFERLAGFEKVSEAEIFTLQGMILTVAEQIGPHLDRIQCTFSQYTDHKIQHLLNIAEIIHEFLPRQETGDNPAIVLNALELAFLWLAILLHDVGMFVSDADEKQQLLDSQDYREFLRIRSSYEQVEQTNNEIDCLATRDAVFAEFIRRQHAIRVHGYIRKYFPGESGRGMLQFRDTDLSGLLGTLCESHNWGVHQSRDSRHLDHCVARLEKQTLIGNTPVNLAYLACCLRLGDILDFDRTRTPLSAFHAIHFSEAISLEEWKKHRAIQGKNITPYTVKYVAQCGTTAEYVAVGQFLNWVDEELRNCTDLVREFPAALSKRYPLHLPAVVNRNEIRMKDPNVEAGAFRFQLEYDQIMRLLMDKSLYPNETLFLRELLQNALDACRFQTARAIEAEMQDKYFPRIQVWDGSRLPFDSDNPRNGPRIVFLDNGVGMSLQQVKEFFMRVGKSYYRSAEFHAERDRLKDKGIHLDACSQFGIGFLSCFMGGDLIDVETYQYGSTPLKITIHGPGKYFEITRLPMPTNGGILYKSPEEKEDSPPHYSGTKISIYLRKRWHETEADPDLVHKTLNAVAVNQEVPVTIRDLGSNKSRRIDDRRWDKSARTFPGTRYKYYRIPPAWFAESSFSLSDFHPFLRGLGTIWLLAGRDGKPQVQRGELVVHGGALSLSREVEILRCISESICKGPTDERLLLAKAIGKLRSKPDDWRAIAYELRLHVQQKFIGQVIRVFNRLQELSLRDLEFVHSVARGQKDGDMRSWSDANEIEVLLSGDRSALSKIWSRDGAPGGGGNLEFDKQYSFALFGIESPGGFQTWNAEEGRAERHGDWLPAGVTLRLDVYGDLAPQPAASRLFVPYERTKQVRDVVTRAFLEHASQLVASHDFDKTWCHWFDRFCEPWDPPYEALSLSSNEIRKFVGRFVRSTRELPVNFCIHARILSSRFGRLVMSEHLNGRHPNVDVTKGLSNEHIRIATRVAGVSSKEADQELSSLSGLLGWDIRKGMLHSANNSK